MQDFVEEVIAAYTMLLSANQWGTSGKMDSGSAPEVLARSKMDRNNLIQKHVSAALKQ